MDGGYKWTPILDYENDPAALAQKELDSLAAVWETERSRLEDSEALSEFNRKLHREWAIETGLIERVYDFDRGVTELLIERGIDATLIPHGSGDDPERIASMIQDHEAAIEYVFAFVKDERVLSTSYIKELHQLLTQNQENSRRKGPSRETGANSSTARRLQEGTKQSDRSRRCNPRILSTRAGRFRDGPADRNAPSPRKDRSRGRGRLAPPPLHADPSVSGWQWPGSESTCYARSRQGTPVSSGRTEQGQRRVSRRFGGRGPRRSKTTCQFFCGNPKTRVRAGTWFVPRS